jgi:glycerol-3-phosphate O-acyltransferase/dihydroxyacetone phosphate acyltransferase
MFTVLGDVSSFGLSHCRLTRSYSWLDLQRRVLAYQKELRELGIRDYQVPGLDREKTHLQDFAGDEILKEIRLPYQIVHLLVVLALAAIPGIFLNLPVGVLAGLYAERRREKALANSKVKVRGFDVMLTEKVIFCIAAIPTLWFIYFLLMYFFTDFDGSTIALCLLSMPLFAYVGIIVSEAGMVDIKDLRPYCMRLFPSSRVRLQALPQTRKELQTDMRAFIKKVGPALGEIYYGKELNWTQIQERSRTSSLLTHHGGDAVAADLSAVVKESADKPEIKKEK